VLKKKVAKKAAVKKKVAKKAAVKKKVAARKKVAAPREKVVAKTTVAPRSSSEFVITPEERFALIGKAAYHISMKRHPCDGNQESDWVAAEAVIDMLFEVGS
jgi:hypothetical protein